MRPLQYVVFSLIFGFGAPLAQAQSFSGQVFSGNEKTSIQATRSEHISNQNNGVLFLADGGERENEGEKSGNREDDQNRAQEDHGKSEQEDQLKKNKNHDGKDNYKKELKRERERAREDS